MTAPMTAPRTTVAARPPATASADDAADRPSVAHGARAPKPHTGGRTRGAEAAPTTWITVCETCKREDWRAGEPETSGERMAALVEAAEADSRAAAGTGSGSGGLRVRRHACLMGCARACNVAVQARGKMAYTLGGFAPEAEAAAAVVAWARLHAASESGVVAYRAWPEPIKGHFVTRHPPLPEDR